MPELTATPINDHFPFIIAIIIVISYVLLLGIALNSYGLDGIERLSAIYSGFVAAVLGYYFGQKPVQTLTNKVEEETTLKNKIREELMSNVEEFKNTQEELIIKQKEEIETYVQNEKTIQELREEIKRLKTKKKNEQ